MKLRTLSVLFLVYYIIFFLIALISFSVLHMKFNPIVVNTLLVMYLAHNYMIKNKVVEDDRVFWTLFKVILSTYMGFVLFTLVVKVPTGAGVPMDEGEFLIRVITSLFVGGLGTFGGLQLAKKRALKTVEFKDKNSAS